MAGAREGLVVGVIGGEQADEVHAELAYEVGRELGARGHTLVCGGRGGVMREACRGARETGGLTVGILPGDDARDANEFVDVPVVTGLGSARNTIIARTAEALVAVDGSYGTLSEIAFGLIAGRPIVALGSWEIRDGEGREPPILRVAGAREAVDACERLAARARGG